MSVGPVAPEHLQTFCVLVARSVYNISPPATLAFKEELDWQTFQRFCCCETRVKRCNPLLFRVILQCLPYEMYFLYGFDTRQCLIEMLLAVAIFLHTFFLSSSIFSIALF
jgi:hypothetical protein